MLRALICFAVLFITVSSIAQTNTKQWMIGGEGSFTSVSNGGSPFTNNYTVYSISPSLGYFITNGLAGGFRFDFSKDISYNFGFRHSNSVAPFLRYYAGKGEKVKFFIDGSFVMKWLYNYAGGYKDSYNGYSIKIGPAIFLTQHVALEIAIGYYHEKQTDFDFVNNEFQSEVGFKYHFGKKKGN
jgi:hypothetical protein